MARCCCRRSRSTISGFRSYHGTPDWIEKYIFPGGELASVGEMLTSLARTTSLSLYHAENSALTTRARCTPGASGSITASTRVRALGFDERFIRMWDLYLASCEATFLERHAGLFQMLLVKNGSQRALFNEPWCAARHAACRGCPRIRGMSIMQPV